MSDRIFMQHQAILDLIQGIARLTRHQLEERGVHDPAMIGIHTGGVWIAQQLHELLKIREPLGMLDISFYRDDFTRIGMNPQVKPSCIPYEVEERHIILVDDVIQSGRTIRAAMNEIFDFGRPASILLVSLIERSGRELPIQPDVTGLQPPLVDEEHIRLQGPEPLELRISGNRGSREAS
ncbi:MAG TPA: bifunctional pyr operon transcriptional regulator/uracil phosphoribosyltransferase PyrR [Chromatiaceae bacterium]|nr:bifunctional pyr operon transcriptional regulator/uracil phosphoribosyltransferase PyrR [Chromatiaceae bacterium]